MDVLAQRGAVPSVVSTRGGRASSESLLTIFCGLLIAFGWSFLAIVEAAWPIVQRWTGMSSDNSWGMVAVAFELVPALLIVTLVLFCERKTLSSIGIHKLNVTDLKDGAFSFIAYAVVWIILFQTMKIVTPSSQNAVTQVNDLGSIPTVSLGIRIALVFAVALGEELTGRGYAIERLTAATGSTLLAGALAFLGDLVAHWPAGGYGTWVFVPGSLTFVLLYMWRRSVAACAIAHFLVDGYAMLLWPCFPVPFQVFLAKVGL
jgi:membrane protease YdiL (CAAX protease family)